MSFKDVNEDKMSAVPLMNLNERRTTLANGHDSDQYWSDQEIEEFSRDPLENVLHQMRLWPQAITRSQCVRSTLFASAACLCFGFSLGYVLFLFLKPSCTFMHATKVDGAITNKLLNDIDPVRIERTLKSLTDDSHAIDSDAKWSDYIEQVWKDEGFDSVHSVPYKVLLSHPDEKKPNQINVPGNPGFTIEPRLHSEEFHNISFTAFTSSANVAGTIAYVNYGRISDYETLRKTVDTKGIIALIRTGAINIFRMVENSKLYNVSAIIIYPDPQDYSRKGANVYPNATWLPRSAVKIESLSKNGDAYTPYFPAKDYSYRSNEEMQSILTGMPVLPISSVDAEKLLRLIDGSTAPNDWIGELNVPYNIGRSKEIRVNINTINNITEVRNVVGIIKGRIESDRYVLLGNHHDSFTNGAVDPHGGTAVLLELSKAFGKRLREGWRPRRSLVFCSWSAGALGPIGSTEWTEEYAKILSSDAVAYLNLNVVVEGNVTLKAFTVPSLKQLLYDAAKSLPNVNTSDIDSERPTLYDAWIRQSNEKIANNSQNLFPKVFYPLVNEDYSNFLHVLGIPTLDVRFSNDTTLNEFLFPLHYTEYDTFHLVKSFIDPDFKYHAAIGKLYGYIAHHLIDSPILPFETESMASVLDESVTSLKNWIRIMKSKSQIDLASMESAVKLLKDATASFHSELKTLDMQNPWKLRMYNDRMMQFERAFIEPRGLTCLPYFKHVLFSYNFKNIGSDKLFSCLEDLLAAPETNPENSMKIKREVASLTFYVRSAASILRRTPFSATDSVV